MNWFKRLCMFVFGLSGVLSLVALSLVWVGPWTTQARTLITENSTYFIALEVLVCLSGVGLLLCMLVALFAPRNPKETIVAEVDGGKITVTRAAISAQTRHIVEADGTCDATSVRVKVRKRGNVRVFVRLRPHLPVDVVSRGEILYSELEQGLAKVCGDSVKSIGIVFTEPEQQGDLATYVDTDDSGKSAEAFSQSPSQEITVPMSSHADKDEDVAAEAAAVLAEAAEVEAPVPTEPEADVAPDAADTAELVVEDTESAEQTLEAEQEAQEDEEV